MKGRKSFTLAICLLIAGAMGVLTDKKPGGRNAVMAPAMPRVVANYAKLPLFLEANRGQADSSVKFLSRGRGYTLFLTTGEAVLSLREPEGGTQGRSSTIAPNAQSERSTVLRMKLVGANPEPQVTGLEELPGRSNYFHGNDPGNWLTQVPHYARVKYEDVYPGIDLVYYGTKQQQLEYDFVVAPGADPQSIRLRIEGAAAMTLDDEGTLLLQTGGGEVAWQAPLIYQELGGSRKAVDGGYLLLAEKQVAFSVGEYDAGKPLVIDPTLNYATYLGGSGDEGGTHITADSSGNAYVTGTTSSSTDFPRATPFQDTFVGGTTDIFVTKLNAEGTALIYSTFLGGSNNEFSGGGIAVDESGSAYITGTTASTDFPTLNPPQGELKGLQDAFVTKLSAAGSSLVYSTYLGGSGSVENGRDIVVDDSGEAYVTGFTDSNDFPTVNPPFQNVNGGGRDAFVTKLNANGTALVYSTYLGGSGDDGGEGIAVDTSGSAYITGDTSSTTTFPTLDTAPQQSLKGSQDAFVTKLSADGTALDFSTYLGGSDVDRGQGVAVDIFGNAYVTGITSSLDFPTLDPVQGTIGGGVDAFVTKLNLNGTALEYSTYLGGSNDETGAENIAIAVDASASAYVAGTTASTDFPTANELQASLLGACDVFVTRYSTNGAALAFSTYLGGGGCDQGGNIALDASGFAYVTGDTASMDFPTAESPVQGTIGGGVDAFVAKIFTDFSLAIDAGSQTSATVSPGGTATYDLILTPDGFSGTVFISCSGQPTGAICAVVPNSIGLDGTNTETFRVTVTTTAPGLVVPPAGPSSPHPWPLYPALFLAMLGLALAARGGGAFNLGGGIRRATVVVGVTLLFAVLSISCGISDEPMLFPTTPGTSTLTITANSGEVTRTFDLTLVVN